jgi:3'-5' exonuclease
MLGGGWKVRSLGAPHCEDRGEAGLIQSFVDKIETLRPQLITYSGASFDLPVLRYRGMINQVSAPGLESRRYFYRYGTDALDLCDVLACFDAREKVSLNDLCRALGYPGKPVDIDGSQVARYVEEGRIAEVAAYCETDVVSTFRVWLTYELFRGALTQEQFRASEESLFEYLGQKIPTKPHLSYLLAREPAITVHVDGRPPGLPEITASEIVVPQSV